MSQLYLVKDKKERIFGPYTEQEICFHIEEGELKGNEVFCTYPTGKWKALSTSPVFYKKIIAQLNRVEKSSHIKEDMSNLSDNVTEDEKQILEPTRILKLDTDKKPSKQKKLKIKLSKQFRDEVLEDEGYQDVIDMDAEGSKKGVSFRRLFYYLLFVALSGLLVFAFLFFNNTESENLKFEHFLAPENKSPTLKQKEVKSLLRKTLKMYKESTIESYLKAQKNYITLLENSVEEQFIYSNLCFIYLELWPFSYQGIQDKQSLQKVLNIIRKKDKSNKQAQFCLAVKTYIDRNFKRTIQITDFLLKESKFFGPQLIYYLKAKAYNNLNQRNKTINLLNHAIKIDPNWIPPFLLKADIYYKNQKYNLALQEYQKVLKIFPENEIALIRMGLLQYKHLKQHEVSLETFKKVFSKDSLKVSPNILFEAYLILATFYQNQNKEVEFIKYSKKAYILRPDNPDVLRLKEQIQDKFKDKNYFQKIKVQPHALIFQGNTFMFQGDCEQAIKLFKQAYQFTKHALAAFRVGQCSWELGMKGGAIRWIRTAINLDPHLLEGYIVLSDYLSKLYEFESARETLSTILTKYPNNPDIYRAYAKIAFSSYYYSQALAYGEKTLDFYPYDVETLVLLSGSYLNLKKFNLAYNYAKKAIQLDVNDSSAQISFALVLDHTSQDIGTEAYLRNLIKKLPNTFEYHQALAQYFYDLEKYEEARVELEILISKNFKLKEAYMLLGFVYNELGVRNKKYYKEAIKQFREASLLDLSDVKPFFQVGQIYLENKNYDLALEEFNKIVRMNPNYPLIHYYTGFTLLNQNNKENLEQALESAKVAAVKNPKSYLPYKLAGDVYKLQSERSFKDEFNRKKMYELCTREYQKALKYIEKSIEVSMNLLKCYKGAGHYNLALELAHNLTQEEGLDGYPEVYRELGILFEFNEEYEKAKNYYEFYFKLKPRAKDRKTITNRITKKIASKKEISNPKEE